MKAEKQLLVDDLLAKLQESPYLIVADYTGLKVDQFQEMRTLLKEVGGMARIHKNTTVKRALEAAGLPELSDILVGQTIFVTGTGEAPAAAKVLKKFNTKFEKPEVKGGILDGRVLSVEEIAVLASLPSRDELLGQLLSVINAPASKLVRTLNEPGGALARVINAKAEKNEG